LKTSKDKKPPPDEDSANEKQGSLGRKMIRLDDLIPKQDVKEGRRVFFGGPNSKSTEKKPEKG